jgi:hypothetical protein
MATKGLYAKLMKRKSFRESTPRSREIKLKRAESYRRKKRKKR